jgi:hypothetical protein
MSKGSVEPFANQGAISKNDQNSNQNNDINEDQNNDQNENVGNENVEEEKIVPEILSSKWVIATKNDANKDKYEKIVQAIPKAKVQIELKIENNEEVDDNVINIQILDEKDNIVTTSKLAVNSNGKIRDWFYSEEIEIKTEWLDKKLHIQIEQNDPFEKSFPEEDEKPEELFIVLAEIIEAQWVKENKEVEAAKVKGSVKVSLKTKNINNEDNKEITISILDAKDNSELSTKKIKIKDNKGDSEDITIENDWNNKELLISITMENNDFLKETYNGKKKLKISCCEHAIIKGDTGDLIKEINIRLAGFGEGGCPLPQNTFDDRTEKAVKQFQKDYMELDEVTGIICKDTLEALDQFKADYDIPFDSCSCNCSNRGQTVTNAVDNSSETNNCQDFGDGSNNTKYLNKYDREKKDKDGKTIYKADGKTPETENVVEYTTTNKGEMFYAYEYPGMHRSLMWGFRALRFYVEKNTTTFTFWQISDGGGYRCRNSSTYRSNQTTNHMGKALDIQFAHNGSNVTGKSLDNANLMAELRDAIHKKLGIEPKSGWGAPGNRLAFEPTGTGTGQTWSWLHLDVRTFQRTNPSYLADEFFANTLDAVNGADLITLLNTIDSGTKKEINSCEMKFEKKKKD